MIFNPNACDINCVRLCLCTQIAPALIKIIVITVFPSQNIRLMLHMTINKNTDIGLTEFRT